MKTDSRYEAPSWRLFWTSLVVWIGILVVGFVIQYLSQD
jgi:hypothetical protein